VVDPIIAHHAADALDRARRSRHSMNSRADNSGPPIDFGVRSRNTPVFAILAARSAGSNRASSISAAHAVSSSLRPSIPESIDMSDLLKMLADQNIFISARGRNLRITPPLYCDAKYEQRLIHAITNFVSGAGNAKR
jgi:hypothetical protein